LRSAARPTTIRDEADIIDGAGKKVLGGSPDLYGNLVRSLQASDASEDYLMAQLDVTGKVRTGFLQHTLLVGADADRYNTVSVTYNPVARYDSINIFEPSRYAENNAIPNFTRNTRTFAPIRRVGAYVQDLITISEKLKLLAGVRYSYQETGSRPFSYATNESTTPSKRYDDAFSPRVGLVYQPIKTMSLFASYANSFAVNTGLDVTNNSLPPSILNQYELGIKNDLFQGVLSANVTAYQIVNSNLAQPVLQNDPRYVGLTYPLTAQELAGEVTSRGVEVDVLSKPYLGWSFIGGYSYNQTKYTKSNAFEVGSLLRYNPNHTANASVYYTFGGDTFLKGLNAGIISTYIGERQAGRSTRRVVNGRPVENDLFRLIPLKAYTLFDLSVGYTLDRVSLRLKASNLLDAFNYNAHDDNSINPINPRQFSGTLSYQL
jgi:iron complex outermembrane receptor protein